MKTLFKSAALIGLVFQSSVWAGPIADPIFNQLKLYRNYFWIDSVDAPKPSFTVWFVDLEYMQCDFRVKTLSEISALTKDNFDKVCSWGGLAIGPSTPPAKASAPYDVWQNAFALQVKSLFPKSSDIRVAYIGKVGKMRVTEAIPASNTSEVYRKLTVKTSADLNINENLTDFVADGSSYNGGVTFLCFDFETECDTLPKFAPIQLKSNEQGHSLLGEVAKGIFGTTTPSLTAQSIKDTLLETARQILKGNYQNPISKILAGEESGFLPAEFNQKLEYQFNLYGRKVDFQKQIQAYGKFEFDLEIARKKTITATQYVAELGLTFDYQFDLSQERLTVNIKDQSGKVAFWDLKVVNPLMLDPQGNPNSPAAYAPMPELQDRVGGPKSKLFTNGVRFPGWGDITSIDVYPSSQLRTD